MSLLSGLYPSTVGVCCNGIEMPHDIPCLQHILGPYGYHTANIGKLHFKNHASQFREHRDPHPLYGFDTLILSDEPGCYDDAYIKWVEMHAPEEVENCRCDTPPAWTGRPVEHHPRDTAHPYAFRGPEELTHTAFVADETVQFIRQHAGPAPFFCISGFYAPHAPINPPARFIELYDPEQLPLPHRLDGENYQNLTEAAWRNVVAHYYALVSHIDDQIGRILTALDDTGQRDNTIVIFTADHGEHLGDHGQIGKGSPHDSAARVPLIIRYPNGTIVTGQSDSLIELVDVAPTILDWCGIQTPPALQGKSLLAELAGSGGAGRSSAYMEIRHPGAGGYKAIRTRQHLYERCTGGRERLWDLAKDPHQTQDIADLPHAAPALDACRKELLSRWFDVDPRTPLRTGQY